MQNKVNVKNTYIPAKVKPTLADKVVGTNARLIFHCIFTARGRAPLDLLNHITFMSDTIPSQRRYIIEK